MFIILSDNYRLTRLLGSFFV